MGGKKKRQIKKKDTIVIVTEMVDEKIISQAIVKAYMEIEQKKREEERDLEAKFQHEWNSIIGQKEYPADEKWYLRQIHKLRNSFVAFLKMLFFKSKDVRDTRMTLGLIRLGTIGVFSMCKWGLYICSAIMLCGIFQKEIECLIGIFIAAIFWFFARIFRIAAFEIEKIKDTNLLIAIFSGSLSFVAVVLAIITLWVG